MAGKRRLRGDRAFKKLLAKLPDAVRQQIAETLDRVGRQQLAQERARVAVGKTGNLRAGLSYKVLKASLKLKVGLIGKPVNRRLYYGRFVEFGVKAKTVIVTRSGTLSRARQAGLNVRSNRYKRAALNAGVSGAYKLRIRARPARHFVYSTTREQLNAPFRKLWEQALRTAAQGISDD